jgi:hypothetical protein
MQLWMVAPPLSVQAGYADDDANGGAGKQQEEAINRVQ